MITAGQSDMTAGGRKKYLFDTDFGEPAGEHAPAPSTTRATDDAAEAAADEIREEAPPPPPPPTFSEEDMARARQEGAQAGRDEAIRDMAGALEQRLAAAMDAINTRIAELHDAFAADKEERSRDAIAVAAVIVRKLFPALNMDKAMAEIEHMIVEAMKRTSGAPTLIVRVPSALQAEVEKRARELAALRGREGTVSILPDGSLADGDVRVEWEGGGMIRDTRLIWQEIDEIIERNLGGRMGLGERAVAEQEVENPAIVGENGESAAESPPPGRDGAADTHEG